MFSQSYRICATAAATAAERRRLKLLPLLPSCLLSLHRRGHCRHANRRKHAYGSFMLSAPHHCFFTTFQVTVNNTNLEGQVVMGRADKRLGKLLPGSPKDLRFRGYFGISAKVAVMAWDMMDEHDCLPFEPIFLHLLWALAFMKTYPANDKALSTALGGKDPKTIRKYVWLFIRSIFDLESIVVS